MNGVKCTLLALFLTAFTVSAGFCDAAPENEIRTLLPKDAIPSIDAPEFVKAEAADKFMQPDEMVIGLEVAGDKRAYSVPLLSSHEIVNDVVGGRSVAVTW